MTELVRAEGRGGGLEVVEGGGTLSETEAGAFELPRVAEVEIGARVTGPFRTRFDGGGESDWVLSIK